MKLKIDPAMIWIEEISQKKWSKVYLVFRCPLRAHLLSLRTHHLRQYRKVLPPNHRQLQPSQVSSIPCHHIWLSVGKFYPSNFPYFVPILEHLNKILEYFWGISNGFCHDHSLTFHCTSIEHATFWPFEKLHIGPKNLST